ncbi:hypothetical protein Peur_017573 [Populus x canadensis]
MIAMILAYPAFCVGLRWTTLVLVPMNMSACAKMDTMFSWHLMDHPAMECQLSGRIFMAGFLHHLPSILVFTAPIPYSYDRLFPPHVCWGRENKEACYKYCLPTWN